MCIRDRSRIERETQRAGELSLRLSRLEMEMEHLLEHVAERHRLDVRRVLGDYHFRPVQDESHKERLSDLLRLVERMGEINLTAVAERHRLDVRRVLGDYHFRPVQDESHKERLSDLLRLVERMGEINLTAIEE